MKKLMFAAAAIAAGVAVADVTSANVVGYANDTLKSEEWKSVCSQFLKIGSKDGSDMKLGELIPGGPWGYGTDLIKVFKTSSAVDFNAVYMPEWSKLTTQQQRAVKAKGWTEATWEAGWYPMVGSSPDFTAHKNDFPLPFGTCVLVQAATDGAYITSNGEVVQPEDKEIVTEFVSEEWKFVGNCTPVARTLKDFVPGNGWGYGTDLIKVFKTSSAVDFNAVYMPEWSKLTTQQQRAVKAKGWTEATWEAGWYPMAGSSPDFTAHKNDYPIPAGSGFLAQAATTGATITQPSAL